MTRFLLNDEEVTVDDARADLTLLDYLREKRGLIGTKEGCASGDCGACTVVIADAGEGSPVYRSCNSCITFLGSLHGRQLLTVEHLSTDDSLHPVQQAMVDQHGSQCGFCTPGFVMSMFALYKSGTGDKDDHLRHQVEEYLGGNLCRCTGYRPIISAAIQALEYAPHDRFFDNEQHINQRLHSIQGSAAQPGSGFLIPESCEMLSEMMARYPQARLLGGGTDLALEVTQQLRDIDEIIYLGRVRELLEITGGPDGYTVGAAVSLQEFHQLVKTDYPDMDELMLRFGSRQVRNLGTIGGNIANASPIGDLPPVLLALGASLTLQSTQGTRTIAADAFFLGYRETALEPGEFLRAVHIPAASTNSILRVYKVSKRLDDDISAVCAVFWLTMMGDRVDTVRVAFGGMAAIPKRAPACEQALTGSVLDDADISRAQAALEKDFEPIDDVRASAAYRIQVAQNLLVRLQLELASPGVATRVTAHAH